MELIFGWDQQRAPWKVTNKFLKKSSIIVLTGFKLESGVVYCKDHWASTWASSSALRERRWIRFWFWLMLGKNVYPQQHWNTLWIQQNKNCFLTLINWRPPKLQICLADKCLSSAMKIKTNSLYIQGVVSPAWSRTMMSTRLWVESVFWEAVSEGEVAVCLCI